MHRNSITVDVSGIATLSKVTVSTVNDFETCDPKVQSERRLAIGQPIKIALVTRDPDSDPVAFACARIDSHLRSEASEKLFNQSRFSHIQRVSAIFKMSTPAGG
jgi:hypothetical protein